MINKIFFKTLLVLVSSVVCLSPAEAQQKTLTILHTNDTHSTVYPLHSNLADTMKAGRGGFLRRIALLEEERSKDPDLLYFDSGDFSQGSPYYSMFKGDVEIGLMNRMKVDASTIGNHEFDFGLDNMVRLFRAAKFPIVCSNYDFTGTPGEGVIKPYVILKRKGLKIGVFALDPPLEGLVSEKNYPGVKYLDPVAKANEMVQILKKKKCDLIVCISHMGWGKGESNDQQVLKGVHGVDLVLGGHSHTYMQQLSYTPDADGRQVPVDQNGKHGIFIGKLQLTFDKK